MTFRIIKDLPKISPTTCIGGLAGIAAFFTYYATMLPGLDLEQSGALATAAQHGGVGRHPGYPLWHLLARFFITLFGQGTRFEYSDPIWATNFLSVVSGALMTGLLAALLARLVYRPDRPLGFTAVPAWFGSLGFACHPTMWAQCITTETHALTLLMFVTNLLAIHLYMTRPTPGRAILMAFFFGLSLSQSQYLFFLLPGMLLAIWLARDRQLFGAVLILGIVLIAMTAIGLYWDYPSPTGRLIDIGLWAILLTLGGWFLPRGRSALVMMLVICLGLSLHAYLLIRGYSDGKDLIFGPGPGWNSILRIIGRSQYESFRFHAMPPAFIVRQLVQFSDYISAVLAVPFLAWILPPLLAVKALTPPNRRWLLVAALIAWVYLLLFIFFIRLDYLSLADQWRVDPRHRVRISHTLFLPILCILWVGLGLGLHAVLSGIVGWFDRRPTKSTPPVG